MITIKTIPYKEMRYPTVGDWDKDGNILVAELGNPDYEFLIALHELVEMYLCKKHGVTEASVTAFDLQFEEERKNKSHSEEDEPGDDGRSPYFHEHQFASTIEAMVARELGVDEKDYSDTIVKVGKPNITQMSDENKASDGDSQKEPSEQNLEPQGTAPVPQGTGEQEPEHSEEGTSGGEGKGASKDEVPQQGEAHL